MSFIQFNLPILRSSLTNNIIFHAALRSIKEYYTRGFYICQGNAKRHGQIWTHFLQVETQVSGLCFPVFEQNTEVYEVNLCIQT